MKRHKVIIPQSIAEEGLEVLKKAGCETVVFQNADREMLMAEVSDCAAILVRTTVIDRELIVRGRNLKVIARHGVGLDNVDIAAATEHGVKVCNAPLSNINSVAEHVVGMMIALSHQIVRADKALRQGKFEVRNTYIGTELKGKTVGIIGFGNIGRLVAKKCAFGLEMKVVVYDPYVRDMREWTYVRKAETLDELLEESDYVSLHMPYVPEMHHFINAETFRKMKKTAFFINAARGGLVDEGALYDALVSGAIAGAGLDCFEQEPAPRSHPLWQLENVVVTPHMAAHTKESMIAMAVHAAEEIVRVLSGQEPKWCVNWQDLLDRGGS